MTNILKSTGHILPVRKFYVWVLRTLGFEKRGDGFPPTHQYASIPGCVSNYRPKPSLPYIKDVSIKKRPMTALDDGCKVLASATALAVWQQHNEEKMDFAISPRMLQGCRKFRGSRD